MAPTSSIRSKNLAAQFDCCSTRHAGSAFSIGMSSTSTWHPSARNASSGFLAGVPDLVIQHAYCRRAARQPTRNPLRAIQVHIRDRSKRLRAGNAKRMRVTGVGAGKGVQHQRGVGDRASHQPEMNEVIEAVGHLAVRDQAQRRLQADDAGAGGGQARAGAGIGCQRKRAQVRLPPPRRIRRSIRQACIAGPTGCAWFRTAAHRSSACARIRMSSSCRR